MLSADVRGQIYALLAPLQVALVTFGVVNVDEAALWVNLITAFLGLGFAAINATNWRRWFYGILAPLQAVIVFYGIANESYLTAVFGVVAAVLGLGYAAAKTPTSDPAALASGRRRYVR